MIVKKKRISEFQTIHNDDDNDKQMQVLKLTVNLSSQVMFGSFIYCHTQKHTHQATLIQYSMFIYIQIGVIGFVCMRYAYMRCTAAHSSAFELTPFAWQFRKKKLSISFLWPLCQVEKCKYDYIDFQPFGHPMFFTVVLWYCNRK